MSSDGFSAMRSLRKVGTLSDLVLRFSCTWRTLEAKVKTKKQSAALRLSPGMDMPRSNGSRLSCDSRPLRSIRSAVGIVPLHPSASRCAMKSLEDGWSR